MLASELVVFYGVLTHPCNASARIGTKFLSVGMTKSSSKDFLTFLTNFFYWTVLAFPFVILLAAVCSFAVLRTKCHGALSGCYKCIECAATHSADYRCLVGTSALVGAIVVF